MEPFYYIDNNLSIAPAVLPHTLFFRFTRRARRHLTAARGIDHNISRI